MISTDVAPVLGLEESFPPAVVVLVDASHTRYGRMKINAVTGVMVWSSEANVPPRFLMLPTQNGDAIRMNPVQVSFD